jgi:hypothetical protein
MSDHGRDGNGKSEDEEAAEILFMQVVRANGPCRVLAVEQFSRKRSAVAVGVPSFLSHRIAKSARAYPA